MSSNFGKNIKIQIFGQSHSEGIGVVIDGLPANEPIDLERVGAFLQRRAPGKSALSTHRKESDTPKILSGLIDGKTCGAPLCAIIENTDTRSGDYSNLKETPRPSHADYTAHFKYFGSNDIRGGGHFSGRLTAPLCFAGAVCLQILERKNIYVGAHIASVGKYDDILFDPVDLTVEDLLAPGEKGFPVISDAAGNFMKTEIEEARLALDSVGGTVECAILGLPVGLGDPMFDGVENNLAKALFGIPAVKGLEFGAGFTASRQHGSEQNDSFYYDETGNVKTHTNNAGGILGGITTGMPVVFRTAFKPTASISREQSTVNLTTGKDAKLTIVGRHDPCIVHRAVPVVEAVAAAVILDMVIEQYGTAKTNPYL